MFNKLKNEIRLAVTYAARRHETYVSMPIMMDDYYVGLIKEWAIGSYEAYNFEYEDGILSFDF